MSDVRRVFQWRKLDNKFVLGKYKIGFEKETKCSFTVMLMITIVNITVY